MNQFVIVTNNLVQAARQPAGRLRMAGKEVLKSPHCLMGTVDQMCDTIWQRRERFGISYIVVPEVSMDAFAPAVSRLAGK